MFRIIIFFSFLFLLTIESFSQDKPRVYFSGIRDSLIKKTQLFDTSIRVITNSDHKISGIINVYFSGEGFINTMVVQKFIGSKLMISSWIGLKEKLTVGSIITIDGYLYIDKNTQKKVYFEGCYYKIIADYL